MGFCCFKAVKEEQAFSICASPFQDPRHPFLCLPTLAALCRMLMTVAAPAQEGKISMQFGTGMKSSPFEFAVGL